MEHEVSARQAAELAARASFGRLLSWLAWQWRDISAAEDALSAALLKALERWPVDGVPDAPDAWLLTVAKRELLQAARHDNMRFNPAVTILLAADEAATEGVQIPDNRLKLMFICAHPAIEERVRIALMLQTVLGLQVAEIAPAMLLSPTALAQRLVRAKQKIRNVGLRFEEPEAADLPQRMHYVLEAIYGAFGMAVDALEGAESRITDLRAEALYLCSVIRALMPNSAEAAGLMALMLFVQARAAAHGGPHDFIPLSKQDVNLWDRDAILRADQILWEASLLREPGPFQLEAAVQSAHCHRMFLGSTPWNAIVQLYTAINQHFPTEGSRVAGAVALAEAGQLEQGLEQLEKMDTALTCNFQPWWVAYAHLLGMAGRIREAKLAYDTALGLTSQPSLRAHLEAKRDALK